MRLQLLSIMPFFDLVTPSVAKSGCHELVSVIRIKFTVMAWLDPLEPKYAYTSRSRKPMRPVTS